MDLPEVKLDYFTFPNVRRLMNAQLTSEVEAVYKSHIKFKMEIEANNKLKAEISKSKELIREHRVATWNKIRLMISPRSSVLPSRSSLLSPQSSFLSPQSSILSPFLNEGKRD